MPVHALSRVAVQGHVSGLADVVALTLLRVVEWKILLFACLPQTQGCVLSTGDGCPELPGLGE